MDPTSVARRRLSERVLQSDGDLPLALLLEYLVPVSELRDLARKFGLSPKGGFRLERAPAKVLAQLLAEQRTPERVDDAIALLLVDRSAASGEQSPAANAGAGAESSGASETKQLLTLRDAELARLREHLDRAREGARRGLDREAVVERKLQAANAELIRLRRRVDEAAREPVESPKRDDKQLLQRLRDLESERQGFVATDEALRRQLARNQSRLRELEDEVAELEVLVPKKARRKRVPLPAAPDEPRRFLLPRFLPSFYKSLEGKERKSIERAIQAVLLFCTEGHAYPGLEVKQIGGQDTWSLRASLGLRVYFRNRPDGDIDVLELADREDQHTTLRRLKER